jgi:hypothetical protein
MTAITNQGTPVFVSTAWYRGLAPTSDFATAVKLRVSLAFAQRFAFALLSATILVMTCSLLGWGGKNAAPEKAA